MCLITPHKEKKIAEEDMIVYKILSPDGRSILQSFMYKVEKLYETEIKQSNDWCPADEYARNKLRDSGYENSNTSSSDYICIGQGFHSCRTIERAEKMQDKDEVIFECMIPKGSEYYEDVSELLVSNKIIVTRQINDYELSDSEG